jgi:aminopeptidase N
MGDEAFWSGIRAYYGRYMNANASTADFRRVMEEASGLDLRLFFEQWLYSGGNPRLEGWWDYDPTTGTVRIELNQTQPVGPVYELPLEVGIHFEGEAPRTVVESVVLDQRSQRFVVPVERVPTQVTLDPETKVLFEADFGPRGR